MFPFSAAPRSRGITTGRPAHQLLHLSWPASLVLRSPEEPRLITTGRPVRKGTNGGVTLLGFGAALAGGLFMGLTFWLASLIRWVD